MNSELARALQRLQELTRSLGATEAIKVIDAEIAACDREEFTPHFEIQKASILWARGEREQASDLLEKCARKYPQVDGVHYFAGEYLLQLGHFEKAFRYLSACIEIIANSGDKWLKDSAFLLRAFCAVKTGKFAVAKHDLSQLRDDEEMSWIEADMSVSKASILELIKTSP